MSDRSDIEQVLGRRLERWQAEYLETVLEARRTGHNLTFMTPRRNGRTSMVRIEAAIIVRALMNAARCPVVTPEQSA